MKKVISKLNGAMYGPLELLVTITEPSVPLGSDDFSPMDLTGLRLTITDSSENLHTILM